jgi:hypothetical protein
LASKSTKRAKVIAVPVVLILLAFFMLLLGLQAAGPGGISIPGVAWLGGSGGSVSGSYYTFPNGTTIPISQIPQGQLSSQMTLIAINEDGTNTTIYSQGQLPTFKIFGPNGKAIREVDSQVVVAYLNPVPLPSDALALFQVNFTTDIHGPEIQRTNQISADVPFTNLGNGSLVLATMPTMRVLGTDVFPLASDCAQGYESVQNPNGTTSKLLIPQSACAATSRAVNWFMLVKVTVHSPSAAIQPFSLLGSNGASSSFNYDGSWAGGCTNCGTGGLGGPTAPIGGITTPSPGTNRADLVVSPPQPPTGQIPTETTVSVVSDLTSTSGITSQSASASATSTSGILTTTTITRVIDRNTGKVLSTTTKTTKVGVTTSGEVHSTLSSKSIYGSLSIIPFDQLRQFEFAGQTYVINIEWTLMIIMLVGIVSLLGAVAFLLRKPRAKHKSKR